MNSFLLFGIARLHWAVISSSLLGLSVAALAAMTLRILFQPRRLIIQDSYQQRRRERLRATSGIYRWCEPLVDEWTTMVRPWYEHRLPVIQRRLALSTGASGWTAEEFLAAKLIEASLVGLAVLTLGFLIGLVPSLVLAIVSVWGYQQLTLLDLAGKSDQRVKQIKMRLPFAMDMIALMMSAGATFSESLETVVRENDGHPLGDELAGVSRDVALGRPRQEALRSLHERIDDDDVREMVFAVVKGEELGTPLAQVFANQAEQMRLKRSQWVEKASAEAQVKLVYPGMLIMIACLFIVVAPFLLKVVAFL